jgi:hypothetical protein
VTLFIKKFNKFIKRRMSYKGERKEKPMSKRVCYNYGKNEHFVHNAYMRGRKKTMTRERSLTEAIRKTRNILRRNIMVKFMLPKSETQVMRIPNQKAMT